MQNLKENKSPSKQKFAVVNIREMKVIKAKQLEPIRSPLQKILLQYNAKTMVGKAQKEQHVKQIFIENLKKGIEGAAVKVQAEKKQQDKENERQRIQPDRVKKLKTPNLRSSYCRFCSEPHLV